MAISSPPKLLPPPTACKEGLSADKSVWVTCGGSTGTTASYKFCTAGQFKSDGTCEVTSATVSTTTTPLNTSVDLTPNTYTNGQWTGKIDYLNQKNYADVKVPGGATWATAGCGIMAGAMVFSLRTGNADPGAYNALYDEHGTVTSAGTGWFNHKAILESNGFGVVPVSGSVNAIKNQIVEYSKEGNPVWINAYIQNDKTGAWVGHHTLAVGVDAAGNIILDDPYYGENYPMPIERIDIDCSKSGTRKGKEFQCGNEANSWIVNAIIP